VPWDNEASGRKAETVFEGFDHPGIGSHPSLEDHRFGEGLTLAQIGDEIQGQGVAESGNDVGLGCTFLKEMDHIALGENAASTGNPGWMVGLQSKGHHLFNLYSKTVGLQVEK